MVRRPWPHSAKLEIALKHFALILALLLVPHSAKAQTMSGQDITARLQQLEDRAALKSLVDIFSNLADAKDVQGQLLLFTEDATVDSYVGGQLVSSLKGRDQIGQAFSAYLAQFDAVYHQNGQQTVELHGDRATGVAYSLVVLIGMENGKRVRTTSGVTYEDEYIRRDGRWLIARRKSHFVWRTREDA
jgi:ketosteroid isomerase-like protein